MKMEWTEKDVFKVYYINFHKDQRRQLEIF